MSENTTPTNERETKVLEVGTHKVKVHTYVTGRELRNIEAALYDDMQIKQKGAEQEVSGISGKVLQARQDAQILAVVVEFDGVKENIIDAILDLPGTEYATVIEYVKSLTEPKKAEAGNEQ